MEEEERPRAGLEQEYGAAATSEAGRVSHTRPWHCCCFWGLVATGAAGVSLSLASQTSKLVGSGVLSWHCVLFGQLVSRAKVAVVVEVVVGRTSPSIDFPQNRRSAAVVLVLLHQSRGQKFLSPENIARFIWTVLRDNNWRTWSPFLEIIPVVRMRAGQIF